MASRMKSAHTAWTRHVLSVPVRARIRPDTLARRSIDQLLFFGVVRRGRSRETSAALAWE